MSSDTKTNFQRSDNDSLESLLQSKSDLTSLDLTDMVGLTLFYRRVKKYVKQWMIANSGNQSGFSNNLTINHIKEQWDKYVYQLGCCDGCETVTSEDESVFTIFNKINHKSCYLCGLCIPVEILHCE